MKSAIKWVIPVLGLCSVAGCVPKAAVSTKMDKAGPAPTAETPATANQQVAEEEVFTFVEQSPRFPGGDQALLEFLRKNIQYPADAREKNESGKVMVQFIVKSDGQLENAQVMRGVSESIDREALRVVELMPRWEPGKQNGRAVNVRYMLPISFMLD